MNAIIYTTNTGSAERYALLLAEHPLQQDPDDLGDVPVVVDNQYFPRHSPIFSKSLDGLLSHRPPPEPPDGKNFKISRKFIMILTDCMIFQQIAL